MREHLWSGPCAITSKLLRLTAYRPLAPAVNGKEMVMYGRIHARSVTRSNPPHYIEMYCHGCDRTYAATNPGLPCRFCRSTAVVPAGPWRPEKMRRKAGVSRVL